MTTNTTTAYAPIVAGTRVRLVKGCQARELPKGITAQVESVTALGAEYGHSVRVVLVPVNGFKSGRAFSFYARHENRLSDPVVRMNTGNPAHTIEVVRA